MEFIDPEQWLRDRGWTRLQVTSGGEWHWRHPDVEDPAKTGVWSLAGAVDRQLVIENDGTRKAMGLPMELAD